MDEHVLSFPMRVTVVSPLHIGSGDPIDRKWFVWNGERATILDPDALLEQVLSRQRTIQFERFCSDPQATVGDFLSANQLSARNVAAYTLRCPRRPSREILPFIKTHGKPYLPGSSLKGALRSSLLRAYYIQARASEDPAFKTAGEHLEEAAESGKKNPGQPLEWLLFSDSVPRDQHGQPQVGLNSNYDLLRTLGIGDSSPLANQKLQILPVSLLSAQRDETLQPKNFQFFPELLTPGTWFHMTVRFDVALLFGRYGAEKLGLTSKQDWILEFTKHCSLASKNLLEQDIAFYESHKQPGLAAWCAQQLEALSKFQAGECLLPMGWGTGYDAKTVTDLFGEEQFYKVLDTYRNTKALGRPGRRGPRSGPELSPKTRRVTTWQDKEMPLGWIRLRF